MAKLDIAVLIGAESKQWLADFTTQIDRLETLAGTILRATPATGKTVAPETMDAQLAEESENEVEMPVEKPQKKRATKGKKAEPEVEAEAETEVEADDFMSDEEPEELPPSIDDVRKAIKSFAAKHGKDKTLKLLNKFKATAVPDIKKGDYPAVIALCNKYL